MKKTYIFLFFSLIGFSLSAQTSIPKAQSMFIYNFSRLIEWPSAYKTGDFVIGVLGTTEVSNELDSYTVGKKVGVQNIKVERYKDPAEITNCHILFVSYGKSNKMSEVNSRVGSNSTLVIAEKRGAIDEGAAINFLIIENALKFELKPSNASKCGLKLNPKLNEMAVQVY